MAFRKSSRGNVPPFIVMDVMRAAARREAAGGDVLHLEVGQPAGGAPAAVRAAAARALESDPLGYTLAAGRDSLRRRIAAHYHETYGVTVAPERICVTTGSSAGFLLAFLAAFDVGDRVAVAAPGYPAYRNILTALGLEVVEIPVGPASRWQITAELLRGVEGKLDGVVVASPANPTGSMLSAHEVAELAEWCELAGIRLISDEIYHGIAYGRAAATAAGLPGAGHAIVVNSFSKYYAMTGWRVGWLVVPPDLDRAVECLQQNLFISPPTLAQIAAEAAFGCRDELDARIATYRANRDLLLDALPGAGFADIAPADGAFYLYVDLAGRSDDSAAFCARMLAETGIATTPGTDFDPLAGRRFLRISYAGSPADIAEAARRLKTWR
ncbi:pyridoxal phosphate-dependent aminotransferase [Phaeospirillum tilakii]|uniref:Aminotransferase n=1 Tax=Phaeospirillum tilakii TaxID=741673 RepID=A0ABW5C7L6_9PROT